MAEPSSPSPSLSHTSRGTIIHELKKIWDEIGESDNEKEKMLLELEQECLDIYQRKVEYMRNHKADLYEALAEGESEIARLSAALGVTTPFSQIQGLGSELIELWNLLETSLRDKNKFEDVIGYNKASVDEVQWPKALSQEVIEQAENEVARLKVLKGLKMEDLPQSPGQIAQLDILEEGSRMMEYQSIPSKDHTSVSPMGPKLVAVYVQERFARRKEGGRR